MGFFFSNNPTRPPKLTKHEEAHRKACVGEKIPHRYVDRRGEQVIEGEIGSGKDASRRGAIALYAGYMAGGGDDQGDRKDALKLAREAGMSESELRQAAGKYT
jgi:hypothetical protein